MRAITAQSSKSRRTKPTQLAMLSCARPSALLAGVQSDELLVDNFAGGGGASTGIELATGRSVDIAINHDPQAIEMHAANHPFTRHYCENVWDIDPKNVCAGRPVGIAWFSPDCTHHSRARGYKPVDKNIRGLAWVAIRWGKQVAPRVICLENVQEFEAWGPVIPFIKDGVLQRNIYGQTNYVPDPARTGITFKRFITTLRNLGYRVEWRTLNAAWYGAPTLRKRFFLVARRDEHPIVWPEPTHGNPHAEDVIQGHLKPYRMAAECIDFSTPFRSIFDRKKPLAPKTERRLAKGVFKLIINDPSPYVIPADTTLSESNLRHINDVQQLLGPFLIGAGGPTHSAKPIRVNRPICTIMPENHRAVAVTFLTKFYGTAIGSDVRKPMPTITAGAGGGHMAEVRALLAKYENEFASTPSTRDPLLVHIKGEPYMIVDIALRMLSPRELAYAQFGWTPIPGTDKERSLAADYVLTGTQANQVAKIGNSVPPLIAAAIVGANYNDDTTALPMAA